MCSFKWSVVIHHMISISISLATLVNVTVDDTYGDSKTGGKFTYFPPHRWNNSACHSCFDGTWHDGTANTLDAVGIKVAPVFATIPFFGSAVYVYCIIANKQTVPNEHMDITFLIDSQPAGNYFKELTKDGTFQYNVLVYANQSLSQGNHNLTLHNGRVDGAPSRVLLDYIVYSYDDDLGTNMQYPIRPVSAAFKASTSDTTLVKRQLPQENFAGKIIGGVLGSIGGILFVLVAFLWHRQLSWKRSNDLTLSPKRTSIGPVARMRKWWRNPGGESASRFSFNPSLLVEPVIMNQREITFRTFRRPPPVTTAYTIYPLPERPDSTHLLRPNRVVTPTPSLDPRTEPSHRLSIIEWQQRTQREADDVPPRLDVSDVEMSSYYDFSSDMPDFSPPQLPPRTVARRFTVVNH